MKASEFRSMNSEQLQTELEERRKALFNLRMQRGAGQLASPAEFSAARKDIARIKTIMTENAAKGQAE